MKDHQTTSYFAEGQKRKILGFPEKTIYRFGVLVFYILLFFAVSIISNKLPKSPRQSHEVIESK